MAEAYGRTERARYGRCIRESIMAGTLGITRRTFVASAAGAIAAGPAIAERSAAPSRVIIDTDPGVDDAFALLLAMRSPELKIEGITPVAGNVPLTLTLPNALR